MQLPVTLSPKSEPEPDIAVVRIDPNEYGDRHPGPEEIFLIIEVLIIEVLIIEVLIIEVLIIEVADSPCSAIGSRKL